MVTRWLQTTLVAPMLVAAWCTAGGWQAAAQGPSGGEDDDSRVPVATWTSVKPETVGYSSPRLESLRSWLKTLDTKAMLIAVHGQVIFEYGDVAHASKVASVRKSVLSMLYGPYFLTGRIDVAQDRRWSWAWRRPSRSCRSNTTRRSSTC